VSNPLPPGVSNPVLAIDSNWDSVTKAAMAYREKHVYPYFSKRKMGVTRLQGNMARRVFFEREAPRKGVLFITGVGHGSYDSYTGDMGEPILQVGSYKPREVAGRIIHLLSCKTAGTLGPDTVGNGAFAFFGYSNNFVLVVQHGPVFFKCDSEIDRALAERLSASDVHARTTASFEFNIDELAKVDGQAAALLNADLRYLCTPITDGQFGKRNARLDLS